MTPNQTMPLKSALKKRPQHGTVRHHSSKNINISNIFSTTKRDDESRPHQSVFNNQGDDSPFAAFSVDLSLKKTTLAGIIEGKTKVGPLRIERSHQKLKEELQNVTDFTKCAETRGHYFIKKIDSSLNSTESQNLTKSPSVNSRDALKLIKRQRRNSNDPKTETFN